MGGGGGVLPGLYQEEGERKSGYSLAVRGGGGGGGAVCSSVYFNQSIYFHDTLVLKRICEFVRDIYFSDWA